MASSPTDPAQVERVGEEALRIVWGDGHSSVYSWELLRVSCPCAACREAPPHPGPGIRALEIKPVGRYAVAIRWSDGHATGIYSHELLRSLCPCEVCQPNQTTEG